MKISDLDQEDFIRVRSEFNEIKTSAVQRFINAFGNAQKYLLVSPLHQCRRGCRPSHLLIAWSDKPGKFGDPRGHVVLGVQSDDARAFSRWRAWQIEWNAADPASLH
jgi:hypothetical protein